MKACLKIDYQVLLLHQNQSKSTKNKAYDADEILKTTKSLIQQKQKKQKQKKINPLLEK